MKITNAPPHIRCGQGPESVGRESTTEQSLGGNAAELVDWPYDGQFLLIGTLFPIMFSAKEL